jgi:hypothetical protein
MGAADTAQFGEAAQTEESNKLPDVIRVKRGGYEDW